MLHVGLLGVGESDTCIHSLIHSPKKRDSKLAGHKSSVVTRKLKRRAWDGSRSHGYCGLYLYAYAWRDRQPPATRPRPHATPSAAAPRQPLRNPEKAKRQGPLFPFRSFHDDPAPTDRPLPMPSCPNPRWARPLLTRRHPTSSTLGSSSSFLSRLSPLHNQNPGIKQRTPLTGPPAPLHSSTKPCDKSGRPTHGAIAIGTVATRAGGARAWWWCRGGLTPRRRLAWCLVLFRFVARGDGGGAAPRDRAAARWAHWAGFLLSQAPQLLIHLMKLAVMFGQRLNAQYVGPSFF